MREYKLEELSASRIQYDKNPPKFMHIIVYIVLGIIVAFLVWSGFSPKTDVIKAQSLITTNDKIVVMSSVQSSVVKTNGKEGDYVEKGAILFELDDLQVKVQITALDSQLQFFNKTYLLIEKMISKLKQYDIKNIKNPINENPFTSSDDEYIYFNQYISFLESIDKIELTKSDPDNLGSTIDKTEKEIEDERRKIVEQNLAQCFQQKAQYEYEIINRKAQRQSYLDSLASYIIKAEISGYLHFQTTINVGMVVSPNNILCTLSSKVNDENVVIEALVSVSQIPFVEVGDYAEIVLAGVLQSEFGTLKGQVIAIDTDNTVDQQNGTAYFKVKIKPSSTNLKAKDGRIVVISNGLMAESRITFHQTTWLKYFLKQIGILDK